MKNRHSDQNRRSRPCDPARLEADRLNQEYGTGLNVIVGEDGEPTLNLRYDHRRGAWVQREADGREHRVDDLPERVEDILGDPVLEPLLLAALEEEAAEVASSAKWFRTNPEPTSISR